MDDTGMDRMQAYRHVEARNILRARQPERRREPVAELRIPLSHPVLQHSGVIGCALRGQVIDRVKVTATQLVIYSHRRRSHDD